ncbi:aldo/keto reductase [Sphingomonas montanisoli]|uniref:Aldo/keto reductase n=1 Tax=Sphingomonas montanisoli TaxID=2606412 RepID=A0A5D9C3Z2_9SPHN|nr:aldo/keto reductase [Sphingomonas montanisoli]TZG26464.1 aldo/keto reductase [Sphingomonas montanisoli]
METRFLGRSGLALSVIGFGTMTFNDKGGYFDAIGTTGIDTAKRQIDLCIDAGVNWFDTADTYAAGRSEEILGEALGTKRRDVIVATKAFNVTSPGPNGRGLSRRHLIEACDASLKRLGTDWIDIYQVHGPDMLVPMEETLRALDDLVRAGKVRYVACSNHAGWQLMKALGLSDRLSYERYIGQQIQYSLLVRDAEHEMLPCGVDQGVGAVIWSPLAQGYLSGKFRDGADSADTRLARSNRLTGADNDRARAVVDVAAAISDAHGVSPAQVALAWLLARPGVTSVIIGARSDDQLRDNLAAADLTLSADEIARLDTASQTPLTYPDSHFRQFASERNPPLFARY